MKIPATPVPRQQEMRVSVGDVASSIAGTEVPADIMAQLLGAGGFDDGMGMGLQLGLWLEAMLLQEGPARDVGTYGLGAWE